MNVYVTVGTQLPFDRLVRAIDEWAARSRARVIGQIGRTALRPAHIEWRAFLESDLADRHVRDCDLVVAHAGIGTILTRLEVGRPLVIMPRRASLGEHRNDHQIATARRLSHLPCITVIEEEGAISDALDSLSAALEPVHRRPAPAIGAAASPELLSRVRDFILASVA